MGRFLGIGCAGLLVLGVTAAQAYQDASPGFGNARLQQCMDTALSVFGGDVRSLKYKSEDGAPVYDLDIIGADGLHWEVECDGRTGHIKEIEREVEADDPVFAERAEISEADARARVLDFFPGEVESVEYELESDGSAVYEFAVRMEGGGLLSVEVDATSGAMRGANVIHWKIGEPVVGPDED